MIIFDLDGTLADCEHRRHFVDPSKRNDCYYHSLSDLYQMEGWYYKDRFKMCEPPIRMKFIPEWPEFYDACDKDTMIRATCEMFLSLAYEPYNRDIQIWSGRCESTREKTIYWIEQNIPEFERLQYITRILKMRPIGDSTPNDQLKERWLDEALSEGKKIDFVVDDRPRMWRRRGIFVFDVNQTGREF